MNNVSRTRRTPEQWRKIIIQQRASGETAAAYCRKIGLCKHSFYGWRKQLEVSNKLPKNGFFEIKPQPSPTPQVIHVETPSGFRLSFLQGVNPKAIKNILEVLEQA